MSELITGRFNLIKNENLIFSWKTLHAQLKAQQLTGEDLCNLPRPPLPHCLLGCIEESKEMLSTCALERPVNKDMASHPASRLCGILFTVLVTVEHVPKCYRTPCFFTQISGSHWLPQWLVWLKASPSISAAAREDILWWLQYGHY